MAAIPRSRSQSMKVLLCSARPGGNVDGRNTPTPGETGGCASSGLSGISAIANLTHETNIYMIPIRLPLHKNTSLEKLPAARSSLKLQTFGNFGRLAALYRSIDERIWDLYRSEYGVGWKANEFQ